MKTQVAFMIGSAVYQILTPPQYTKISRIDKQLVCRYVCDFCSLMFLILTWVLGYERIKLADKN